MFDVFVNYLFFLLKTLTVVAAFLIILANVAKVKGGKDKKDKIIWEYLNEVYNEAKKDGLQAIAESGSSAAKDLVKQEKKRQKDLVKVAKKAKGLQKRFFVLNFKGNLKADQVKSFRQEITTILSICQNKDEVIVVLESPGGSVIDYGLACAQLARIRDAKISLTVCVDKVAASGGYLMACVADQILAAPFAYIGSIGVVMQLPNVHKFLKNNDVDVVEITAGVHKRPLSMLGENTKEGKKHMQEKMQSIHEQFKSLVKKYRPNLDMEKVATGDYWTASEAIKLGLLDNMITSDEYIQKAVSQGDVYKLSTKKNKSMKDKLQGCVEIIVNTVMEKLQRVNV